MHEPDIKTYIAAKKGVRHGKYMAGVFLIIAFVPFILDVWYDLPGWVYVSTMLAILQAGSCWEGIGPSRSELIQIIGRHINKDPESLQKLIQLDK